MGEPLILYNRYYTPISEGINGLFINHNHKKYIRIYESYYNRVRNFEILMLNYKSNQLELFQKKNNFNNSKRDNKSIKDIIQKNNQIIQQREDIDKELKIIIWLSKIFHKINQIIENL